MTGRWGTQAICAHHVAGSICDRSTASPAGPTTRTAPRSAGSRDSSTWEVVVLPAPEDPASATRRPGRILAVSPAGAQEPRAATPRSSISMTAEDRSGAGSVPRPGRGAPRTSKTALAAATPLAEAWKWNPTCRSGW